MQITVQILLLMFTLIILGLLLKNWKPPIKEQYVFIILAIVGMAIGYYLFKDYQGVFGGFIGAGLVFYKDELVKEANAVKDSFDSINKLKDNTTENNEETNKK